MSCILSTFLDNNNAENEVSADKENESTRSLHHQSKFSSESVQVQASPASVVVQSNQLCVSNGIASGASHGEQGSRIPPQFNIYNCTNVQVCNNFARHHLLDAKGTISLLILDLERGDPNPTGLPTNAIQAPLQNLSESVAQLINILPVEIEKREQAEVFDLDSAYSTSVTSTQSGPGRRRYDISKDQLEHLRSLFFSWQKIADMLQRRRREFGLSDQFERYSDMTDDELDQIYSSITEAEVYIQRWRVSECLRRVDPVGTALRWRMTIHGRKYFVPTPNSLWHIDSGHKLIRYKLITHVCIDGKSRLLIYASCCNNNKADTVLSLFQNGVEQWGLPSRVRCDYGIENFYVGQYMIEHRGEGRGSIITGSSVHNSRVERAHRDIYSGVLAFYARIFEAMEDESILDILDDVHLYSLHHVYLPRINRSLEEFIQQMNNHPVSTENNQSPLQMWERGMLENMHSGYTALSPAEIDEFGWIQWVNCQLNRKITRLMLSLHQSSYLMNS
ncbi:hypothetical protein OS493_038202 [Desmophyllum pertusum]|uniref:Integrase catalytic domain-containing protein n=1 Tax=Desmophyllum pertusum TaxID=174260 RepID=A0A9W9ZVR0_9CNID|nr:hypothetical protein OS493_038202 [Desmophyllum pertusum]